MGSSPVTATIPLYPMSVLDKLEAFFREGMAAGEFRQADPGITARAFIGPTFVFSLWQIYEGDRFDHEALADTLVAQVLSGLVSGD